MHDWIFAHRGDWYPASKPNSPETFINAFTKSFAIETDVRDSNGQLVISHDPCTDVKAQRFEELLKPNQRIAINIKSDGLSVLLEKYLEIINISNSFIFDCSFPELFKFKKMGFPHAIRISEYERELPWKPDFVWLDSFESDWWLNDLKALEIIEEIPTIVVSPELHNRDYHEVWNKVNSLREKGTEISICTDYPNKLLEEFK